MSESKSMPSVTGTTHELPFEKLSPRDFERLCVGLIRRDGFDRVEHLGAAGSEQGRDILAWRSGEMWAFQCKRVKRFYPADALKEVEKILRLPEEERPSVLVFMVTCDVSANVREQVRERCAGFIDCQFRAGTELDDMVGERPDLLERFFRSPVIVARMPVPKDPPIPPKLLFRVGTSPRFVCYQWANSTYPREGEEVQVHLCIVNESQVETRNVEVNIHLPSGYEDVSGCNMLYSQDAVAPYEHIVVNCVVRSTEEALFPAMNLTISYNYGEGDHVVEESIAAKLIAEGNSVWDLVNQRETVKRLQQWLCELHPAHPILFLLWGELGIGKSRVLQSAVEMAHQQGYYVLHRTSHRAQGPSHLDPLRQMLVHGLQQLAPEASLDQIIRGIADSDGYDLMTVVVAAYLGCLIFGTEELLSHLDQHSRDLWVARFLVQLSHHQPLFIAIDDFDLAPVSTRDLLARITEEASSDKYPRIRILVACDSTIEHSAPNLFDELNTMAGYRGRWFIPNLKDRDDTQRLIEQVYKGCGFPIDWAEKVHDLCEGNPLLILEALTLLQREGVLWLEKGHWELAKEYRSIVPVLRRVFRGGGRSPAETILGYRLPDHRADKNSYDYLRAMAVLGRELESEDISNFVYPQTRLSEDEFVRAEEKLLRLGVLTQTPDGLWAITPPILYEAIMNELSGTFGRNLHRRAAEYLVERYGDQGEWAAKIAYHFYEAGQASDALNYLLRAAQWETDRRDLQRTINLYEWVLQDLPQGCLGEGKEQLHLSLAGLYETVGEYGPAQAQLAFAFALCEQLGAAAKRAEIRLRQGWLAHLQQQDQRALEVYEMAQEELEKVPPSQATRQWCRLWRYRSVSTIRIGHLEEGYQLVLKALGVAEEGIDNNEKANIHLDIGLWYFEQGKQDPEMLDLALKQYEVGEKVLGCLERMEDVITKAKFLVSKAAAHSRQREDDLAFAEYIEAIALARQVAYLDVEAEAHYGLGVLAHRGRKLDQAIHYLRDSVRLYTYLNRHKDVIKAYDELFRALARAERWADLLHEVDHAEQCDALSLAGIGWFQVAVQHLGEASDEYLTILQDTEGGTMDNLN